jgi:uncharacterized protein (TIGR02453 family)
MPTQAPTDTFTGFSQDAIDFLAELAQNNDRAWFQPRKADYEGLLKRPMEAMIAALAERLDARGIPLRADPARSMFRIYRDTRFAKDKSPYKTHMGASFPWLEPGPDGTLAAAQGMAHANGGYFHFQPGQMYVGGGMYMAEKPRLDAFRRAVVEEPERIRAAIEDPRFVAAFGSITSHDALKRMPPGLPADHPMAELFLYKDVVFGREMADTEVLSPDLPEILADAYDAGMPVFRLLATIRG